MQKEILISLVSLMPAVAWVWFYVSFHKSERALPVKTLVSSFIKGLVLSAAAVGIEFFSTQLISNTFGAFLNIFSASQEQLLANLPSLIIVAALSAAVTGLLEATIQNYFIKNDIKNKQAIVKVLQGVQLSLFFGLGFAIPKNLFYIFQNASYQRLDGLVLFQVLINGLAYVISAGVLGYFISLAKFHKLYEEQFLKRGFQILVMLLALFHFNFSLLRQIFSLTVWITLIVLGILMKYLIERRNFEISLIMKEKVSPPIFYEKREIITFLVNEKLSYNEMKRLAFCPNCFIIKKEEWKICPYCETKF